MGGACFATAGVISVMEINSSMAMHRSPLGLLAFLLLAFAPISTRAADCGSTASPKLDWQECSKKNLMLQGSDLEGANLFSTDFSLTDLSGGNFKSANLEKATLVRASLEGSHAEGANFAKVEAYRASFANIAAEGASFAGAELQRANFGGARLSGASFEKAELGRADFDKAVLTGVKFSFANLSRADLSNATFEGPVIFERAFMFLTRIEGLDLSAAAGLEQAQIDLACGDASTKLPSGLSAPATWPCPAEHE
ncbi:pentapeptide repeat-containing protein [Rhizobium phaseoli]|uniref:Pentapeptide repeat-containing protein n=3 Tax=Rhizobium TaxID=379 RepID=A0ABN4QHW6_9HYPH|nr:pentapeptide repeat-containing protein [Rhizobium phaseoli]MDH6649189.1 uncharacterized protein YjbI with pentapeptide repeats [Rhizobium esperanzae]ANL39742.1 pentapeptide repeat-containing protein [Rhizobium phaseoli]ANL52445.1 pentapeptide repeat-containing protein [Rhizobium phaseoli]ANL58731.1 pentapeptide repeat-containing protein [Rhizobium phaseoli]